ncbi:hypothetical protein EY643_02875 [Halioglobus maricola]|uniref:Sulfotransferase domain-containing protein n=1 Tax=Halioglobus maricola TaxID=2601894 RepID=A0A5P9NFX3_9GAMM|nr:sulfotransferase domain-containing protein [Halioglobus maricola]QFU74681.1 hypothetical protein EY643_02875 [Halioglobus maricola]
MTGNLKSQPKVGLFLIGASKCASTYLHGLLDLHPNICMSSIKEPRIFQRPDYSEALDIYMRCFGDYDGERYLGESSPSYSETIAFPSVSSRIHEYNRSARIVYVVRNPVDRLYSVWAQAQSSGHDIVDKGYGLTMPMNFLEAVHSYPPFMDGCRYWTHIESYRKYFSDDSIKVVLFETLVREPAQVLEDIWKFLELDVPRGLDIPREKVNSKESKMAFNPWPARVRKNLPDNFVNFFPEQIRYQFESKLRRFTRRKVLPATLASRDLEVVRDALRSEVQEIYAYMEVADDPWGFL